VTRRRRVDRRRQGSVWRRPLMATAGGPLVLPRSRFGSLAQLHPFAQLVRELRNGLPGTTLHRSVMWLLQRLS